MSVKLPYPSNYLATFRLSLLSSIGKVAFQNGRILAVALIIAGWNVLRMVFKSSLSLPSRAFLTAAGSNCHTSIGVPPKARVRGPVVLLLVELNAIVI